MSLEGFDARDLLADAIVEELRGLTICEAHDSPVYHDEHACPCCRIMHEVYVQSLTEAKS